MISLHKLLREAFLSKEGTLKFLKDFHKKPVMLKLFFDFRMKGQTIFHFWACTKDFNRLYQLVVPYFMNGRENFLIKLLTQKAAAPSGGIKTDSYMVAILRKNREFILTFFPFVTHVRDYFSLIADFIVTGNHIDLINLIDQKFVLEKTFIHDKIEFVREMYGSLGHEEFKELMNKTVRYQSSIQSLRQNASHKSIEFMVVHYPDQLGELNIQEILGKTFLKRKSACYEFLLNLIGSEQMKKEINQLAQRRTGYIVFNIILMKVKEFDFPAWLAIPGIIHRAAVLEMSKETIENFQKNPELRIKNEITFFERLLWIYIHRNKAGFSIDYSPSFQADYLNQIWMSYQTQPDQTFFKWSQRFDPRRRLSVFKNRLDQEKEAFFSGRLLIRLRGYPRFYRWLSIYFQTNLQDLQDLLLLRLLPSLTENCIPNIFN